MKKAVAVIGLGYGDEGKGTCVARLCYSQPIDFVIRFSGGCQAAHNVITDDDRHHCFSQFGSGTFSRVPTYISQYMFFEPFLAMRESQDLSTKGIRTPINSLLFVAWNSCLTTPYHQALNCYLEEVRGDQRHGSTAHGIGITAWYRDEFPEAAPVAQDLLFPELLKEKLTLLRDWVKERIFNKEDLIPVEELVQKYLREAAPHVNIVGTNFLAELLTKKNVVFEGSQGVLLDEHVGFFPHVTRTVTTDEPINKLYESLGLDASDHVHNIGVIRSYTTRHGHGPFVAEDNSLDLPESHNRWAHWMGGWRTGHLDLPALKYALRHTRIDSLYITHMDRIGRFDAVSSYTDAEGKPFELADIDRYDFAGREKQTQALLEVQPVLVPIPEDKPAQWISDALNVPLKGTGHGPKIGEGEDLLA